MTCSLYGAAAEAGAGLYGFYDSHNQVVVIPSLKLPPHVVVDHEITHVNLVNNSALGRLEQVIVFTRNLAYGAGVSAAAERIWREYGRGINQRSEMVHEATAWYGTELQTEGHENFKVPVRYASWVARIRHVVEGRGLARFGTNPDADPGRLDIVEDAAIYALDSPVVATLWANPAAITPDALAKALSKPADDPGVRFRAVLDWLAGLSTTQMIEWSRSRAPHADREHALVPVSSHRWHRGGGPLPAADFGNLTETGTVDVIAEIARHTGLFPAFEPAGGPSTIDVMWKLAKTVETFARPVERYAQVCVLEPTPSPATIQEADQPPDAAMEATRLIVGVAPPGKMLPDQLPWPDRAHVIYHVPGVPERVWIGGRDAVHQFLADRQHACPVIATSRGYDLAVCDYGGVLGDVEHVVMALTDVRSLLFRLCTTGGLGSSTQLEFDVLRSPRLGSDYGYLLLKAAGQSYPIIIVPIVASYTARILEYVRSGQETEHVALGRIFAQARGVSSDDLAFSPARQSRMQWVGPLARHITAAVAAFERWD